MKRDVPKVGVARNYSIDALRFIAICFVVFIHVFAINPTFVYTDGTTWKFIDILLGLSRLAVPVFFAISGWFIFSKDRRTQVASLSKQVPKLLKILLISVIGSNIALWLIYTIFTPELVFNFAPNITELFQTFALGRSPILLNGPLWFLVSLIIVEGIFWLFTSKFKRDEWLMIPAFVFFGLNLSFGAYQTVTGFNPLPFPINENWYVAFAWFSVGYFLAKYFKERIAALSKKTLITFSVITGLLYVYEDILHTSGSALHFGPYNYNIIFLFTPLFTAGIFLLAARSKAQGRAVRLLARLGRNYALGIFIVHFIVMEVVNQVMLRAGILDNSVTPRFVLSYLFVLAASLALCVMYYKLKMVVRLVISRRASIIRS